MKKLLFIFILIVSFNIFAVECIRTFKFTKTITINLNNKSAKPIPPSEEIRHGFEDAVFIVQSYLSYHTLDEYYNSAHPEFNFIIISNLYFPIDTPPPLLV